MTLYQISSQRGVVKFSDYIKQLLGKILHTKLEEIILKTNSKLFV